MLPPWFRYATSWLLNQRILLYQITDCLLLLDGWDYTFCQSEKQGNYFYPLSLTQQANPFLSHSCLSRAQDGLRPIRNLQLAEDVGDVIADCFQAEH